MASLNDTLTGEFYLLLKIVKEKYGPEKLKCIGVRVEEPEDSDAHLTVKVTLTMPRAAIIPELEISLDRIDLTGAVQNTKQILKELKT